MDNNNFGITVLKFSDSKVPEFREVSNKDYILCGEKNDYPEYLIYQYNKCGKHRAIINSKARYIFGGGLKGEGGLVDHEVEGVVTKAKVINSNGETMDDILQKSIKDIEIHGGFRWFISKDRSGGVTDIKHVDFYKIRTAKPVDVLDKKGNKIGETNNGYFFKEKWISPRGSDNQKEDPVFYPEYSDEAKGVSIFAYNEYGPGSDYYPLPEYVGCANYIDIDIEIGKFHLSAIKNGMMPSKMIQFYTGEPNEEKKKEIEKRFSQKFAGSENAGRFVLVFNPSKEKQVDISDLSFSELDKQFDLLAKTVQQELFTGHQIVYPGLFGVKTEGQLGGSTELKLAYEIFINNYAKPKQVNIEKAVNYFSERMGLGIGYNFVQLDPVGIIFDAKDFLEKIPTEYVFEKLGIPEKYWETTPTTPQPDNISGQPVLSPVAVPIEAINDNLKNLTAKQHQQLIRVIRQYSKGQLTVEAAKVLLRTGLGLNEMDLNSLLGIEEDEQTYNLEERQKEIDLIVKPKLRLNYIVDEKILSKKIPYEINGKKIPVSVKKIQDKIKQRMEKLESQLNEVYG